jgi:hypothetical protein
METGCIAQSHLRALTYLLELMPLRYEPPQDKDQDQDQEQEQEQRRPLPRVATCTLLCRIHFHHHYIGSDEIAQLSRGHIRKHEDHIDPGLLPFVGSLGKCHV